MKGREKNFKIPKVKIALLTAWQKLILKKGAKPDHDDVISFLDHRKCDTESNRRLLKKWTATRYKRGILNETEIKIWYEFYYKVRAGFSTGYSTGPIVRDKYQSFD